MKKLALFLFAGVLLGGCSSGLEFIQTGSDLADSLAKRNGWTRAQEPAGKFPLVFYRRITAPGRPLAVYIEGDGAYWINRQRPADPTPEDPDAFRLAIADPAPNKIYLSRPCQYLTPRRLAGCDPVYWDTGRLAPDVIAALNEVIDREKKAARAETITLYGKSGGGVAAALVAARRHDVRFLMTAASYLDVASWTSTLHVTPLRDSLNPTQFASQLAPLTQVHIVGAEDDIVPPSVVESYMNKIGRPRTAQIVLMPNFDHGCSCWSKSWVELLKRYRPGGNV